MQPQLVMEKLGFLSDSLEPHDLPSFNTVKITVKQAQIKRQ